MEGEAVAEEEMVVEDLEVEGGIGDGVGYKSLEEEEVEIGEGDGAVEEGEDGVEWRVGKRQWSSLIDTEESILLVERKMHWSLRILSQVSKRPLL